MNELYDLKEMLLKELEEYGKKGDLSAGSLDIVDKLAHSIKNLCKVIEDMDGEYSGAYYPTDGMSYRRGGSYARGRGRNARRDSMGRYSSEGYSRAGDLADQVRDLMREAPDEQIRQDMERLASKLSMM